MNVRSIILAAIMLTGCSSHKNKLESAIHEARASGKILMVEFESDWCSDCRILSEELQKDSIQEHFPGRFVRYRVDVGQFDRNLDIAKSLGLNLSQIPTAVFFTPGGDRIERSGLRQIREFLTSVLS